MSSSTQVGERPAAASVEVDREWLRVNLRDGRRLSIPITWFEWLARATDPERADFEIIEDGNGIWWNTIDEGLSVPGLFGLPHI